MNPKYLSRSIFVQPLIFIRWNCCFIFINPSICFFPRFYFLPTLNINNLYKVVHVIQNSSLCPRLLIHVYCGFADDKLFNCAMWVVDDRCSFLFVHYIIHQLEWWKAFLGNISKTCLVIFNYILPSAQFLYKFKELKERWIKPYLVPLIPV